MRDLIHAFKETTKVLTAEIASCAKPVQAAQIGAIAKAHAEVAVGGGEVTG